MVSVNGDIKSVFSYADDIKLIADSEEKLQAIFLEVANYLRFLGLTISTSKCKVLVVGGRQKEV